MRWIYLVILCSIASAQTPVYGPSGSVTSGVGNSAPQQPNFTVSPSCLPNQANCLQIYGDTKLAIDATTNSTTTVTCPDCAFTQADVGKVVWATSANILTSISECPQTTIAAVNSATSITLTATCTASLAGTAVLIWGHDDGAALATLDTVAGCNIVHVATNGLTSIMFSQPFFVHTPSCENVLTANLGAPAPYLLGDGFGASQASFIMTPNFNWGGCQAMAGASQSVCIGGSLRGAANIQIFGTGLTPAANANCANASGKIVFATSSVSSVMYGIDIAGICPGQAGLEGIELNNYDQNLDLGGAQQVGQWACVAYSKSNINMRANDCRNDNSAGGIGLYVKGSATLYQWSSYPIINALVNGGSLISEFNTYLSAQTLPSVEVQGSGTFVSHNDTTNGLKLDNPSFVTSSNDAHNAANGITISNAGNFTDLGANYWATTPPSTTTQGVWQGQPQTLLFGSCRGVATAASTLGLYGLGQFAINTCTSTVTGLGMPYRASARAGKASTLACKSTAAGVNASSGVVTVLKNTVATSLTCTFGTTTSCLDNTHTDTPALGDIYSIQFTTQALETLANVTCTVLAW